MPETLLRPERTRHEQLIDEIARRYYDTTTEAAEVLDGVMRTEIPLGYDGYDVYSCKDGTRFGEMSRNSLEAAYEVACKHSNLSFEVDRRRLEAEEIEILQAMARGETPNTMVVISDFPEQLMDCPDDVGGYNVTRKQAMLRIITRSNEGFINLTTQSLDLSNRQALEEIYEYFGESPDRGSLLGQRILRDLNEDEQASLCEALTTIYDESLSSQYGGNWYGGQRVEQGATRLNTYDFVRQQEDLILPYIRSTAYGSEEFKIGFLQVLTERYEAAIKSGKTNEISNLQFEGSADGLMHESDLISLLQQAASRAHNEGRVFSACGGTLKMKSDQNTDYEETGYGNQTNSESRYSFSKKMYCVVCQAPPKKDESKKMCGPCGICKGCDTKIRASGKD